MRERSVTLQIGVNKVDFDRREESNMVQRGSWSKFQGVQDQ